MMESGIESVGRILDRENELFQRLQDALCNSQADWPEISEGTGSFFITETIGRGSVWENPAPEGTGSMAGTGGLTEEGSESTTVGFDRALSPVGDEPFMRESRGETELSEPKADSVRGAEVELYGFYETSADSMIGRLFDSTGDDASQFRETPDVSTDSFSVHSAREISRANEEAMLRETVEDMPLGNRSVDEGASWEIGFGFSASARPIAASPVSADFNNFGVSDPPFPESHEAATDSHRTSVLEAPAEGGKRMAGRVLQTEKSLQNGLTENELSQVFDYMVKMLEEAVLTEAEGFYTL